LATILAKRLKGGSGTKAKVASPSMERHASVREGDLYFRHLFNIQNLNEIVIKEYPCSQKHYKGKLYLSTQHACFYSRLFGVKRKKVIGFSDVTQVLISKKTDVVLFASANQKSKFSFTTQKACSEAFDMLHSLWESYSENRPSESKSVMSTPVTPRSTEQDPEALTNDDWDLLLQGAKLKTYLKGEPLIVEGESFQRIYEVLEGNCTIQKGEKIVGNLGIEGMTGEISFLLSGGATASVIAESKTVEVYIMEGYFINILFGRKPELAGRFYKYLANELQKKVRSFETIN